MLDFQNDPWGAAMVATAGVSAVGLLLVVARQVSGRRAAAGGWTLGLGLTAFLGSAALGTLEQVDAAPAAAAEAPVEARAAAPKTAADASADPVAPKEAPENPAKPDPAPVGEDPTPAVDEPPPTPPEAPAVEAGSALEPVAALPSDPAARKTAIRKVLRAAKNVYEDETACKQAKAVGQAWAQIAALPDDAPKARADVVVRRLEQCRRSTRWAVAYSVHRDRVDARDAFEETFADRLETDHGLRAFIKLSGKNHEKMRVGSGRFDDDVIAKIMTEATKAELAELGFERVVFASGKKAWPHDLDVRAEDGYVGDVLAPYGLRNKLSLD
ncbi:MAG: hypothetical protein AAGA54_06145 [Myxococcota bacterium]